MTSASNQNGIFSRARSWYSRYERPISSVSLIWGFIFDAITLTHVDHFWENVWVLGHLLIVAVAIVLIHVVEKEEKDAETNPARLHFWLVNILQFFFGGLLSTFLVYYYRSATLAISWPFLTLLALAFIANESLKRHYTQLTLQISLFYLSLLAFTIFIIPVIVHQIGTWVFIASGIVSLVVIGLFLLILRLTAHEHFMKSAWRIRGIVFGIFIGVNILYFYNLIPPLPLALTDSGIYDSLTVNAPGNYTVTYEDQGSLSFFNFSDTIHLAPGGSLYAYSAIFSPTAFNTNIIHEWQYYDAGSGKWLTRGRISLPVIGGSDGGYRTFSLENNLTPGPWRVDVETPGGAIIGRMSFTIVTATTTPVLLTEDID
jgi:hypothetical protein